MRSRPVWIPVIRRRKRRRRARRPLKPRFPRRIVNEYLRELLRFVGALAQDVEREIIDALPILVLDDAREVRLDFSTRVEALIERVRVRHHAPSDEIRRTARSVLLYVQGELSRAARAGLGREVYGSSAWHREFVESMVHENVRLITSVRDEHLQTIAGIIERGVRSGTRHESLAHDIRAIAKVSRRRARLIARDQVSRFYGQVTRRSQMEIGIERYVWYTAMDERVRETHMAMEGRTCSWADATVYDAGGGVWESRGNIGGVMRHPGEDINCRCTAGAVFDE